MCVTMDKDGLGVVFFSREERTVMCVTMDKDGLGVVFSPGKSELSCVSPWTRMD